MKKIIIAMVLLLLLSVMVSATDYYVSTTGSDTNPGTSTNQAWRTIGKANANLVAGDTVYIRAGTYNEVVEPFNSGSAGNPITYTNYQNEEVIILGEPGIFVVVAIGQKVHGNWDPKSYIIIDGLTVRHNDPTVEMQYRPNLISIAGENAKYNEIRNCKIHCQGKREWLGGNEHAISLSKGEYNLIENNYIDGLCRIGIATGGTAQYNIIRNNQIIDMYANNINFGSSKGVMQYTLVENNFLCGSLVSDGIQFENRYDMPDGFIDWDSNRGVVVRNNIICDTKENAIDLKGGAYIIIEGNIMYRTEGNSNGGIKPDQGDNRIGPAISHGTGPRSRDVIIRNNIIYDSHGGIRAEENYKIYNNIVVYNNRDYTGPNTDYESTRKPSNTGIIAWNGLNDISLKNNIMGGHSSADLAVIRGHNNLDINNNLYFNPEGAKLVDYRGLYDWDVLTLNEWKNLLTGMSGIIGAEASSIEANPLFIDVPAYLVGDHEDFDFHVNENSPAIDKGGFLTTTTSSGSGKNIPVADSRYFFDGWGIVNGDLIQLEGQTITARITNVDNDNNIITVDRSLTWSNGQGVSLPYTGSKPDIGVYESESSTPPPPPPPPPDSDELVINGDFSSWSNDNPVGWTMEYAEDIDSYVSQSSGRCRLVDADGSGSRITQKILIPGRKYRLTYTINSVNTGAIKIGSETPWKDIVAGDNIPGTKTFDFTAIGTNFSIGRSGVPTDVIFDDVSIKEIGIDYVLGDVDNDNDVDFDDVILVAADFGKTSGFNSRADSNNDGEIDIFDVVFVASRI